MKRLILAALLSTTALAQQSTPPSSTPAPQAPQKSKAKVLTRAEFDKLASHPDHLLLIDVRRPGEIASIGGFPVYLNIQVNELNSHLAEIPRNKTIVTVSNHAARAGVAADLLALHGFKVAGAIGAQTYETEGGTLAHFAASKPAQPSAGGSR